MTVKQSERGFTFSPVERQQDQHRSSQRERKQLGTTVQSLKSVHPFEDGQTFAHQIKLFAGEIHS